MVLSIIFLEDKHKIWLHLSIFYEYQKFFQHHICFSIQPPNYSDLWPTLARSTSFFLIMLFNNHCLLCSVFSKRWLVYAAGTNSDVCTRNYLYPVFLLTKTQPRGFHQWIFIKETPLPDWQGFCKCVLFEITCWGSTIYVSRIFIELNLKRYIKVLCFLF